MRKQFITFLIILIALNIAFFMMDIILWWLIIPSLIITVIGLHDLIQKKHAILRVFPILGQFRYLFEKIRPEISQYFIETNSSGRPLNREQRSLVYQRAKKARDTIPFGTQKDVYAEGYEWISHSLNPKHIKANSLRINIGNKYCKQPYSASLFNISAMSFGSLSPNAVLALNGGAKLGKFAHNTGEGGISPYHKKPEGDLIWQLGTGYFGARDLNGDFSDDLFEKNSKIESVKMIEIKLSQGAKPGHGGILPASKVNEEIAEIRNVPLGKDVLSPPFHKAFNSPRSLIEFIKKLRDLSGGKPIGIKLCIGHLEEFIKLCMAMKELDHCPDFIAIDGGEGGTGAAPLEFSNHIGMPSVDALLFADHTLKEFGLRDQIKIISSGKVVSAFDMIKLLSLGADAIYSARAMMLALGCIQALECNSNKCPTGVATQNPNLYKGVDITDKTQRVFNYHHETMEALAHTLGAMGLEKTEDLRAHHIMKRVSQTEIKTFEEIYSAPKCKKDPSSLSIDSF